MKFKELLEFIDLENKRLTERYSDKSLKEREVILARTVKLNEELGELCSEVLASYWWQRKEKLDKHSKESLEHEFADVIITTLLLAKTMDVDIKKALTKKIEKINKRYE